MKVRDGALCIACTAGRSTDARPATVWIMWNGVRRYPLCDECRAAVAAPLPYPIFSAPDLNGGTREYRATGDAADPLEWRHRGAERWRIFNDTLPVQHLGELSDAELRAIADARESAR